MEGQQEGLWGKGSRVGRGFSFLDLRGDFPLRRSMEEGQESHQQCQEGVWYQDLVSRNSFCKDGDTTSLRSFTSALKVKGLFCQHSVKLASFVEFCKTACSQGRVFVT